MRRSSFADAGNSPVVQRWRLTGMEKLADGAKPRRIGAGSRSGCCQRSPGLTLDRIVRTVNVRLAMF